MTSEMNMENKASICLAKSYAQSALDDILDAGDDGKMTASSRDIIITSLAIAAKYIERIKPTDEEQG